MADSLSGTSLFIDIETAQHEFEPPLSRSTINRLIANGEVEAKKFGTRVYITRESWGRYLTDRPVARIKPRRQRSASEHATSARG